MQPAMLELLKLLLSRAHTSCVPQTTKLFQNNPAAIAAGRKSCGLRSLTALRCCPLLHTHTPFLPPSKAVGT